MTRVRACAAKVLRSTTGARDTSNNTPVVLIPSQPQQVTAVLHERQSQELDSADVCVEGLVEKPQPLKLEQGSAHRNLDADVDLVIEPLDHNLRDCSKRADHVRR